MSASDFDFPTMARALILGDKDTVAKKTREGLALAMEPKELIFKGLIPGMDVVGEKFRRNEYYVPQVLLSARAMYAGLDLLKPLITASGLSLATRVELDHLCRTQRRRRRRQPDQMAMHLGLLSLVGGRPRRPPVRERRGRSRR